MNPNSAKFEKARWGHAEIKSVEPDGKDLVIRGIASTGLADRSNEVVDQKSLESAIDGFSTKTLFHMHNWQAPIGRVIELVSTGTELMVSAVVGKNFDIPVIVNSLFGASVVMTSVNNIREQIKQGVINAFSIGFTADKKDAPKNDDNTQTKPAKLMVKELLELSVVTIPANKDCLFSMAKGYGFHDLVDLYNISYQMADRNWEPPGSANTWITTTDPSLAISATTASGNGTDITFDNVPYTLTIHSSLEDVPGRDEATSDGDDDDTEELIGGLKECLRKIQRS